MGRVFDAYLKLRDQQVQSLLDQEKDVHCIIHVGSATCENAAGADQVRKEFAKLVRASGRKDILIKQTGCTGRCAREPIVGVFVKGQLPLKYERVTPDKVQQIFHDHVIGGELVPSLLLDKKTSNIYSHVVVFCGSYCAPGQPENWPDVFADILQDEGIAPNTIRVFVGGCLGLCPAGQRGTAMRMMIMPDKVTYAFSSREDLAEIVKVHFVNHKVDTARVSELEPMTENFLSTYGDVSFFNKQTRLTLRNSGLIDPESLAEYLQNEGYEALAKAMDEARPQSVIDQVLQSGLRGRGGGGYPTGRKWRDAITGNQDPVRYIICNADEGDPGAFMDRSALEGDPFSIVEGMTIGAFAIGARKGFIYIRAEYPLAIDRCRTAIRLARQSGLLGRNILGSGMDFDIEIRLGAGAYVCGEETALLRSIEGQRGQPVIRPPYPTYAGLWGHPTVINNVETWANVPVILLYGAEWFSRIGTSGSKGTKVFALAGKVNNTGLVEVPMGTPCAISSMILAAACQTAIP
jgi:(2Fe-2S) ferredoxin